MFESKVSKGESSGGGGKDNKLWTKHENIISDMHHLGGGVLSSTCEFALHPTATVGGRHYVLTRFRHAAADGRLVMWKMAECVQ